MQADALVKLAVDRLSKYEADERLETCLDDSIQMARQAVEKTKGILFVRLFLLASCLRYRVRKAFSVEAFDEAVKAAKEAIKIAEEDVTLSDNGREYYSHTLRMLTELYNHKYVADGELCDLDESIKYMQRRIGAKTDDDITKIQDLADLAGLQGDRYEVSDLRGDIMSAVYSARRAEELAKGRGLENESVASAAMGAVLSRLCQGGLQINESDQLNTAIDKMESAINFSPKNSEVVRWKHNLATLLEILFERTGSREVLEKAIKHSKAAVDSSTPDDRNRARRLNTLGNLLGRKFEWTGESEYLDRSIEMLELTKSLSLNHMNWERARWLSNLSFALAIRYRRQQKAQDLQDAIENSRKALSAGKDFPDKAIYLRMLSSNLLLQYDRTKERKYLDEALEFGNEARALTANNPDLCERSLTLDDQQHAILWATGLAADVCSLYLQDNRATEALQKLEFGRGLMLRYMMDRQSNVPGLERDCGDLAKEYKRLQCQLSLVEDPSMSHTRRQQFAQRRIEAGEELKVIIQQIRQREGYESFLLEPTVGELTSSAADGVVVVVNVTLISADAIIVSSGKVRSIQLSRLKEEIGHWSAYQEYKRYRSLALDRPEIDRDVPSESSEKYNAVILEWLWESCVEKILENVSAELDIKTPRVWWIGTGLASNLPFHAAGCDGGGSSENALERTISSYIPSIKALLYARSLSLSRLQTTRERDSVLIVAMPTTPGENKLNGVTVECHTVEDICNQVCACEYLNHPTADEVCAKLAGSTIIHFACHGSANETDPSQSYLLLQNNGKLDKLTVSRISSTVSNRSAWIAYLSACSTAQVKARRLADESLHIASAFQVAGFPHVIGSLWPTDDDICVKVAKYFYTFLFEKGGGTASDRTVAFALRYAVLKVRSEIVSHGLKQDPMVWAAYIHLGA